MEAKNELQKQNLIWISIVLVLIIICSLLFLQNKKIEKVMTILNVNYNPYGFGFGIHPRANGDLHLIEKRVNEQLSEFAREMEELKRVVSDAIGNNSEDYMDRIYSEVAEKNRAIEKNSKDEIRSNKAARKTKEQEANSKKSKNRQRNSYKNSQFGIETGYDKENKEYKVGIKLPNDFNIDDINVTLKNSILKIRIEKEFNKEDKDSSYYNYDSFYQSFTIPKTKATTKDIIKKLEDGKLEIIVPIR